MIDAGKAYNAANKQFVNGIRELAQSSTRDEVIEVNNKNPCLDLKHRNSITFFLSVWVLSSFDMYYVFKKHPSLN